MNGGQRVERHALVVGVRPDRREEYLELHRHVWPQVEQTLREAKVTNYSIFIVGDTLFAYYEYVGDDHAADMARIAADPVTQQWWQLTDPCQESLAVPGSGHWWAPMRQVWHLEEPTAP